MQWTEFKDHAAAIAYPYSQPWRALVERIGLAGPYPDKASCPWVKLAVFGTRQTTRGSLRNNDNVLEITGVEGDYDAGLITPEQALALLERSQVKAFVYTSPSHTEAHPRWRVLAPLSRPHNPSRRTQFLARINGVLGGVLSRESFVLSQSYYYGSINGNYWAHATYEDPEDGIYIDELDELDALAIGPRLGQPEPEKINERTDPRIAANNLVRKLGRKLRTGDGRRELLKSYVASLSAMGNGPVEIRLLVRKLESDYFDPTDPINDKNIEDLINWAYGRDAGRTEPPAQEQKTKKPHDEWIDFGELPDFTTYKPPIRRWLIYGRVQKGFVGFTVSPPGVGKTAFQIATAVDVALNIPTLGEEILESTPTWIYTNEEDKDEMYRRLLGFCLAHDIEPNSLKGRLRISSGYGGKRLVVARRLSDGTIVLTPELDAIIQAIKETGTGFFMADPFVSTHAVNENSNAEIEEVMAAWRMVAAETTCAIDIAAHIPKSGKDTEAHAGSLDAIRGAGAAGGAARSAYTLARMNEESAKLYGVSEEERLNLVRLDRAKGNYTAPNTSATWLRMRSVCLDNNPLRPDYVGVFDCPVALQPLSGIRESKNDERDSRIRMAVLGVLTRVGEARRLTDMLDSLVTRSGSSPTTIRQAIPSIFPEEGMAGARESIVFWQKRPSMKGGRDELWVVRNKG